MSIKQAIILAGGLGTRLSNTVPGLPKCMAPVAGRPFLSYLIDYFSEEGIENFIFSLGFMHEKIETFVSNRYGNDNIQFVVEKEPLGTGGAIKLACSRASGKNVLVLNGDTLFRISLKAFAEFHRDKDAACSLALKPMENFERYGAVTLNEDGSVKSFLEKKYYSSGLINGGVYALELKRFLAEPLPEKFSFEQDYLEKKYDRGGFFGMMQEGYFIDIGIPGDYQRAQEELPQNS